MTSTAAAGRVAGIVKGNGPSVAKELLSALLQRTRISTASFNLHGIGERGRHPIVVVLVVTSIAVLVVVVVVVACEENVGQMLLVSLAVSGGKDPQMKSNLSNVKSLPRPLAMSCSVQEERRLREPTVRCCCWLLCWE